MWYDKSMNNIIDFIPYTQDLSVLYVEDDAVVRMTTTTLLEDLFDDIVIAIDGDDGLKEYQNRKKEKGLFFDIIITDISMPKLNGDEMSKEILSINPNQIIIAMTAYNESNKLDYLLDLGLKEIINKPINFEKLLDVLATMAIKIKKDL